MVVYGSDRYTYESGRTGEAPLAGFAIRGRELVVYRLAESKAQRSLLSRLGTHKMGKTCDIPCSATTLRVGEHSFEP
jgi:hypothetical protein